MIGSLDHDDVGVPPGVDRRAELSRRPELVVGGGDQCLGAGVVGGGELGEDRQHRGDRDPAADSWIGHRERDIGTEAVPGDDHRSIVGDNVDRRPHIELLWYPATVVAGRTSRAAEVEAEHIPAGVDERSGGRVDDQISSRAAVERVGVTDDGSAHGVGGGESVALEGDACIDLEPDGLDLDRFHADTVPVAFPG